MRWKARRSILDAVLRDASSDLSAREDVLGGDALVRLMGNELTVFGRDNFTLVASSCDVEGDVDGAVCVDHRALAEFVHRAAADEVRATLAGSRLKLRIGVASLDLPTRDASGLVLPKFRARESVKLECEPLVRCVRRVLGAAHDSVDQPALWGMQLTCSSTTVCAEACDGRRFARAIERIDGGNFVATLNRRFLSKLLSVSPLDRKIVLSEDDSHVRAKIGRIRILGRKIMVPFPGLGAAMSETGSTSCELARVDLLAAVDTIRAVGEDAPLRIDMESIKCTLGVRSAEGEAAFPINCNIQGGPVTRLVSFSNFRLACQALDTDRVRLCVARESHGSVRLDAGNSRSSVSWVLVARG